MKLEGSLDAFSLPDIFQLLSFTKKSGGLHLRRASTHGCVHFREGAISAAVSDDGRQALARRVVGSSDVGVDDLAAAVERAAAGEIGVARALLEAGAVDDEALRGMLAEQAVDAVFDFLRWSDGDFSFSLDEQSPDDIGVQLNVEEIVTEARARLEAWERACQVIPSPDTVLVVPVGVREEPQLSRSEWALLALVDGRRPVTELCALAGRGDFAVVSALAALVDRGLLVIRSGDDDEGAGALLRRHALLAQLEAASASVPAGGADAADGDANASAADPAPAAGESRPNSSSSGGENAAPGFDGGFAAGPNEAEPAADVADPILAHADHLEDAAHEVTSTSTVASVLAAAANAQLDGDGSGDRQGTARFVSDTRAPVIPPRPEPFTPRRRPDFPEDAPRSVSAAARMGGVASAAAAVATDPQTGEAPEAKPHIERDPSVNKSLLLRLIAGVRGL